MTNHQSHPPLQRTARRSHLPGHSPATNRVTRLQFEALESRCLLSGTPELLRIINPAGATPASFDSYAQVGDWMFFAVDDGVHGVELWKTDGTTAGTVMVKDIWPGPGLAGVNAVTRTPNLSDLTNVNGTLFFRADNGIHGRELWKSDGTAAGTVMVKDITTPFNNPFGNTNSTPIHLTSFGDTLFFTASAYPYGYELWKSDGTEAGTVMVKDIVPGSDGSNAWRFQVHNDMLFFAASYGPSGGRELWKSDGTAAGTVMVKDIWPGLSNGSEPNLLTSVNESLLFWAKDATHGYELWKSDGTAEGTVLVKDINPGAAGSINFEHPVNVNGTLFFAAHDGVHGLELWKSDGTTAGTVMVKDIHPGASHSSISNLTHVNGKLFFRANDGVHGQELWMSDGTTEGTVMVKEINPTTNSAVGSTSTALVDVDGTLYFRGNDGVHGFELWKSDGTAEGTVMVADINPGPAEGLPGGNVTLGTSHLWNLNGTLIFWADDGQTGGRQPWVLRPPDTTPPVVQSINREYPLDPFTTEDTVYYLVTFSEEVTGVDESDFALALTGSVSAGWLEVYPYDSTGFYVSINGITGSGSLGLNLVNNGSIEDLAGNPLAADFVGETYTIGFPPAATVVGRHIFYNQSKFDGNNAAINPSPVAGIHNDDDDAIATDKVAFSGIGTAPLSAFTSYSRGINGILVDIENAAGTLTVNDFTFKVGANNMPSLWADAPAPNGFLVRTGQGVGGSDRVVITWANNAIQNQWLQVIVEGNDALGTFNTNTGLATSDVFFYGNRIGDTFESSPATIVTTNISDQISARANPGFSQPIAAIRDFNRDGLVNVNDEIIARQSSGFLTRVINWVPPAAPEADPMAGDGSDSAVASALAIARFDATSQRQPHLSGHITRIRETLVPSHNDRESYLSLSASESPRQQDSVQAQPLDDAFFLLEEELLHILASRPSDPSRSGQ